MGAVHPTRIRNVTAVLGPTNTGKTHLAIERMLDHETGVIGLPLRLLAREVYDKVCARVGADKVALITGEEKIKPELAQYWICTVEAMPQDLPVQFLAIDEIQLAADPERGHIFTDRLLNARGDAETLVLGSSTMREAISDLIPGANFIARPRLSKLTYSGQKKITRLPARSAIVAFSASEVYRIAELIRRQRGGAAVVLGALSPRTRNAQVALYQSGDVDFLVATDAVGMGLNLDVDHVAFSAVRKFDGYNFRDLIPAELAQVAGRAGRHLNDGSFGVTGDVEPFQADLIERLESHTFDPVKTLQWRNNKFDFASVNALRDSLRELPDTPRLIRARMADDVEALENLSSDREIMDKASSRAAVERLWDVCQIPDYRKISSQNHAELVATVYNYLMSSNGRIDDDWFSKQVEYSDRVDGDIDTLSNRLAHIRTWTFVANRPDWLADPEHWQEKARKIEDNLSDALHERLTQRFVDKKTSALMKGLKDKENLNADISDSGEIKVEDHYVGRLEGFRFVPDTQADGIHGKASRHAAAQVLSRELSMRARRVAAAKNDAFTLSRKGKVIWREAEIASLVAAEDPLKPQVSLIADEHLQGNDRDKVDERVRTWVAETVGERLKPLADMSQADDVTGLAKGIAFQITEALGVLRREDVAEEIKSLDQTARSQLRKYGMRFGAFNIFFPVLLKPAAADLLLSLWCLKFAGDHGLDPDNLPEAPRAGLTSVPVDPSVPGAFYKVYGFHVCGPRAVRIDILERLADQIRPLMSWRASDAQPLAPKGATGIGAFIVTPEMMSILGCSADELGEVLRSLGFRSEERKRSELTALQDHSPTKEKASSDSEEAKTDSAEAGTSAQPSEESAVTPPTDVTTGQTSDRAVGMDTNADNVASEQVASDSSESISQEPANPDAPVAVEPSVTDQENRAVDEQAAALEDTPAAEAGGQPAIDDATAQASVDDDIILVWRPQRRQAGPRRERRGRRGAGNARGPNQQTTSQANGSAESTAEAPGHQHKRGGSGKSKDDRPRQRVDGGRGDFKKGKDNRRKNRDRRNDDNRKPRVHTSSPSKKSQTIDPDSPFAALGALRQSMDEKD
ncbi:MAG: helicase-related protein [Pseudomonadota bacterium]